MNYKYLLGAIATNAYRLIRVFPNSDPIMGFIVPAAKNEPIWKAPLFAFVVMFSFDIITNHFGIWTYVTSTTYALVALLLHIQLKNKESKISTFLGAGSVGILIFDFLTGPVMSTFIFNQPFLLTLIAQLPFTILHVVSAVFSIIIITPFYDKEIMKQMNSMLNSVKIAARSLGI